MQPQGVAGLPARPYVELLYAMAGANVLEPPGGGALAAGLLGPRALRYSGVKPAAGAELREIADDGIYEIVVRRDLSDDQINVHVARCLASWARMRRIVPSGLLREDIALGLLLPMAALERAVDDRLSTAEIAQTFVVPIWVVASRLHYAGARGHSGLYRRVDESA